jgi:UDP-2-acetamido-3-amino-2,3-dideoxy-glucuronate N-acetyltransferase
MSVYVHPAGINESPNVGPGTRIWAFSHVLPGAVIGSNCNICDNVFIENDVVVGDNVTIKCGVQLWDGIEIHDNVFIGPNVTFSNDPFPRSKVYMKEPARTIVENGASIGANSTILPGLRIGQGSMIGAGSVVTKNVPPNAVIMGNPAQVVRYSGTAPEIAEKAIVKSTGLIEFPTFSDERGLLSVLDGASTPFEPKRTFFVYDVPNRHVRGEHAHLECHQLLVCVTGSVRVHLDTGSERSEYILTSPNQALHIPPLVWASQFQFAPGTVLMVLASHPYDPNDYLRTYESFLQNSQERFKVL